MEFYRRITAEVSEAGLRERLTVARLPEWCGAIATVEGCRSESGELDCLWGRFRVHREAIRGGVRFSLPDCPNAIQWSVTTDLPPEPGAVMVHATINRAEHDPDFIESIEEFLDGWADGLAAGLGGTVGPHPEVPLPRLGVGAVVVRDGMVLLVRRAREPATGQWAIPGGKVQPGEALAAAAERELLEETGVRARAGAPIYQFEAIDRDGAGVLRHHYVVVDLEAEYLAGEPRAAADAAEARWVPLDEVADLPLHPATRALLDRLGEAGG